MYFRFLMLAVACAAIVSMASHSYAEEMARKIVQPYFVTQQDDHASFVSPYNEGFNVKKERIAEGMTEQNRHM